MKRKNQEAWAIFNPLLGIIWTSIAPTEKIAKVKFLNSNYFQGENNSNIENIDNLLKGGFECKKIAITWNDNKKNPERRS